MKFTDISIELFRNGYCFKVGSEQYADHEGVDAVGRSRSGMLLWRQAESARLAEALRTGSANMVSAEIKLAKELAIRAPNYVRAANLTTVPISVLEFGPGTTMAFREKTLPLVQGLTTPNSRCILVDNSAAFLEELRREYGDNLHKLALVQDDIFSGRRFTHAEETTFMVMFGRTFGNLDAPASFMPPYQDATLTLRNLAKAAPSGWLAVSVGSNLDAPAAKTYYEAHPDFQLNVFYRMQAEVWIEGDFDPTVLHYEADVRGNDEFLQVVHTAIFSRDMAFRMEDVSFKFKKGDRLHLKNSFCFSANFMREAAICAGLEPIDVLSDGLGSDLHVFRKRAVF